MSIPAPQPHKRHFEEGEELFTSEELQTTDFNNPNKRFRQQASPSGRCGSSRLATYQAYTVGSTTFAAVRGLFPRMSDKVIAEVLAEYGDNIDAAIRHLNGLQLSLPDSTEEQKQQQNTEQQTSSIPTQQHDAAASTLAGEATVAAVVDQTQDQPPLKPAQPVRSAEQWVDLMVEQMSAANSVEDAKARASEVLKGFEQAVLQHADSQEGRVGELARENALLKRAVAIQNARLQELGGKESAFNQLKAELDAARSKVQYLEVQNYSLQLHLKQAADARDGPLTIGGRQNPDVY